MSVSTVVHPTAVVSPEASLDSGVQIGAYAVIGPQVRIGKDTQISSHVHIEGDAEIGARCQIYPSCVLGTPAQARLPKPILHAGVSIGDDNIIREFTTIHAASKDGGRTVVGHRNMLMTSVHIAHDCVVGNDVTMANIATLGGHVTVGDRAVIGGLVGVHQFVRVGTLAMIGSSSKLSMDVPPFSLVDGHPLRFFGVNAVGLKRAGFEPARRAAIRKALKVLFFGANLTNAVEEVKRDFKGNADVETILAFIKGSKRGVMRGGKSENVFEDE